MPKITVIITTYNRANLLKDAIKSVLGQSFQDFELIVVDDCSADNTKEVVKIFQDKRISYLRHPKNKGDAAAKNTGIRAAQGEYIITLDDDDLMAPWALADLFEKFCTSVNKNIAGIYGWSWWIYNDGETLKFLTFQEKGKIFKEVFNNQIFTNVLLKREIFDIIGYYDESLSSNYDADFYLKLAKVYDIDFVAKILFIIRVQEQNHLSQLSRSHLKISQSVRQRYSQGTWNPKMLVFMLCPISFYLKLSLFKHKIVTTFKIMSNANLRQEAKKIREELRGQGVKI